MPVKMTLCHIIKGDKVLLKEATRGISKGKWNGPGGKMDKGETPVQGIIRETLEETGLRIRKPFYHGKLYFHMNGKRAVTIVGYLFSARKFVGRPRPSEEGPLRWFKIRDIPLEKMWDDDRYWINLLLAGRKFDAHCYYDKGNKRVTESVIKLRKH